MSTPATTIRAFDVWSNGGSFENGDVFNVRIRMTPTIHIAVTPRGGRFGGSLTDEQRAAVRAHPSFACYVARLARFAVLS